MKKISLLCFALAFGAYQAWAITANPASNVSADSDNTAETVVIRDTSGNFKTEALHVTEKFIPQDANTIVYEATMTDPTIYTQPWTARCNITRNRQTTMSDGHPYEQMEFGCIEGNTDLEHYTQDKGGKAPQKR